MGSQPYQIELGVIRLRNEDRPRNAPPKFREATFEDYSQISALESHYGLNPKTEEEWTHLWIHNPSYQAFRHWPIGWVCENQDHEIVGSIGNIPLAYEFDGRSLVTATSRGLVADSRYRPYSFSLLNHFFSQKNVDLFLNTSVNDRVFKLQESFRALRVPSGEWNRSAFWITNHRGFTASLLARKGWLGSEPLSYPVSAGLFIRDHLTGKALRVPKGRVEAQFCARFDARFDAFWERVRNGSPRRLLAARTRDVLDWHFRPALMKDQLWVLTVNDREGLAAYGIFCREDHPAFALKRMRLVDFQALDGATELLRPILSGAIDRCQREGIHMLETVGFSFEKQAIIDDMNPNYRELSAWRYFYRANPSHLAADLKDGSAWDPTCFDGDSSL